jgi:hypothetical protein
MLDRISVKPLKHALAQMVREHPASRELKEERLMLKARAAFDIIVSCDFDGVKYRVSIVRLMAEEELA